jgi:hypothetical protein
MTQTFQEITKRIEPGFWLERFESEYLEDFIPSGGSAVRFLSGENELLGQVCRRLEEVSASRSIWFRHLDPRVQDERGKPVQLHRIDVFYRAIAQGYDWSGHARSILRAHLRASGIDLPSDVELSDLNAIAQANDRDAADLAREVKRLGTEMIRDPSMTHEFRLGVAALAKDAMLRDPGAPSLEHVLLAWFEGLAVSGGSRTLKRIGIYDRIRPMNARPTLSSFASWLRRGQAVGTMIVLDLRPYERKKLTAKERANRRDSELRAAVQAGRSSEELERILDTTPDEESVFFSDKAFLQMLDLLRHFIDDLEAFPGMALIVLTTDAFYDERSPRSFFQYNALQTRIAQEVRDSVHPNPVAMLSHLGSAQ